MRKQFAIALAVAPLLASCAGLPGLPAKAPVSCAHAAQVREAAQLALRLADAACPVASESTPAKAANPTE
jgi:hypothetical protein